MAAEHRVRRIFRDDCLHVLQRLEAESVDLIYLDPPFNSNAVYNLPFESGGKRREREREAVTAFVDTWTWNYEDEAALDGLRVNEPNVAKTIDAADSNFRYVGRNMTSYLVNMAIRLLPMKRALRPTGSLYLHCDPTASHYLKSVLDSIFGPTQFLNEITWKRYAAHSLSKSGFDRIADVLLHYAKDASRVRFYPVHGEADTAVLEKKFPHVEAETGRRFQHVALEQGSNSSSAGEERTIGERTVVSRIGWRWSQRTFDQRIAKNPHLIYWTKAGRPRYKKYADEYEGQPLGNIWTDVKYLSAGDSERLGYPTQKPLGLLTRIIRASSAPGDLVLDPFCGCGTTLEAAESLGRQWTGIDISAYSASIVLRRMLDAFKMTLKAADIDTYQIPRNATEAWQLAKERGPRGDYSGAFEVERWICAELGISGMGKQPGARGADAGIDGVLLFAPAHEGQMLRSVQAIVQVKAGRVAPNAVKALNDDVARRPDAEAGILICFDQYRKSAEKYINPATWTDSYGEYPVVQIYTIEDFFRGRKIDLPNITIRKDV